MNSITTSCLEDLPNEIVARVCDCAPKTTLMNLRLANHRPSGFATSSLARNYMFNISVLFTHHSLELLGKICAHPVFGSSIRKLHLVCGRVSPEHIRDLIDSWKEIGIDPEEGVEDVRTARRKIQECMNRSNREYQLEMSGEAAGLLTNAFESLKKHNTSVTLDISEREIPEDGDIWLPRRPTIGEGHTL